MDPDWKEGLSINFVSNFVSSVLRVPGDSLSNPTFPVLNSETPPAEGVAGLVGERETRPNVDALCQQLRALPMMATHASDSSMECQPQERSKTGEEAHNSVSFRVSHWKWRPPLPTEVLVVCKNFKGVLNLKNMPLTVTCSTNNDEVSPGAFEIRAGMGGSKRWAQSLRVGVEPVGLWLKRTWEENSVASSSAHSPDVSTAAPAAIATTTATTATAATSANGSTTTTAATSSATATTAATAATANIAATNQETVWDWDLIRECGVSVDKGWLPELCGKICSKVDDAPTEAFDRELSAGNLSGMEICSPPPIVHCRIGFDASDIQEHAGMDHATYELKDDHHVHGLFERLNLGTMEPRPPPEPLESYRRARALLGRCGGLPVDER